MKILVLIFVLSLTAPKAYSIEYKKTCENKKLSQYIKVDIYGKSIFDLEANGQFILGKKKLNFSKKNTEYLTGFNFTSNTTYFEYIIYLNDLHGENEEYIQIETIESTNKTKASIKFIGKNIININCN